MFEELVDLIDSYNIVEIDVKVSVYRTDPVITRNEYEDDQDIKRFIARRTYDYPCY